MGCGLVLGDMGQAQVAVQHNLFVRRDRGALLSGCAGSLALGTNTLADGVDPATRFTLADGALIQPRTPQRAPVPVSGAQWVAGAGGRNWPPSAPPRRRTCTGTNVGHRPHWARWNKAKRKTADRRSHDAALPHGRACRLSKAVWSKAKPQRAAHNAQHDSAQCDAKHNRSR